MTIVQASSIPRQLLVLMTVFVATMVGGGFMLVLTVTAAYDESNRSASNGIAELTRSYTLLERVSGAEDALQRMVRLKDPDVIEKTMHEIDTQRAQIVDILGAMGPAGSTVRAEYDKTIAIEKQIVDAVLKGDGGTANDLFMESASPRYELVKRGIRGYFAGVQQTITTTMTDDVARGQSRMTTRLSVGAIAVAVLVVWMWRLRRAIVARLRSLSGTLLEAGGQLADTSSLVMSGSQTVSDGANRQAAAIEQTSASLEEIGASASQNAGNAQQAKDLAAEARAAAEAGHHDMQDMMGAMDGIKASSGSIAGIIKTIDEIAFQTNLLALNAAVEAARAGQAGLGFAVVADEVRGLAQRSATAARETASSVEEVIARGTRGVEVSAKVARSLEDIMMRTRRVDALIADIAAASDQQRLGLQQVGRAMSDIEKVTQSGAASAQETSATVIQLNAQAESLRNVVQQLEQLSGAGVA